MPFHAVAPFHAVIDVRRWGDFGIGTYIRNLVSALARLDRENRYTLIALNENRPEFPDLARISNPPPTHGRIRNSPTTSRFRSFCGAFMRIFIIFR